MKDFAPNCPLYVQILKPENKFHVKFAGVLGPCGIIGMQAARVDRGGFTPPSSSLCQKIGNY